MRSFVFLGFLLCSIGVAVSGPIELESIMSIMASDSDSQSAEISPNFDVELDPLKILNQILKWCEENDIKFSDIFNSDFFNSDFFNSDFFNSDYFNSDFFNSDLFNSEIFNRRNFLKLTTALYALNGVDKEGTFQPQVAAILQGFFQTKDWEGLKNYLDSLPDPR